MAAYTSVQKRDKDNKEEETPEFLVQLLLEQWCHRNFKLQYLSLEIITEMVDYTTTHTQ